MITEILGIYRRLFAFVVGIPLLAEVPFAVEMLQHGVEISLELYRTGTLSPEGHRIRLIFGLIKLAGLVIVIVAALRWWRFDGDTRRVFRPGWRLWAGLLVFVVLEILDGLLEAGIQSIIARFIDLHAQPTAARYAIVFAPTVVWTFLTGLWLPWNVGLLVDDEAMTLRQSFRAAYGRLWMFFGLICAGVIPLMTLHYVLGDAAVGRSMPIVWAVNTLDAAVVVLLTGSIASSFYATYDIARRTCPST